MIDTRDCRGVAYINSLYGCIYRLLDREGAGWLGARLLT